MKTYQVQQNVGGGRWDTVMEFEAESLAQARTETWDPMIDGMIRDGYGVEVRLVSMRDVEVFNRRDLSAYAR